MIETETTERSMMKWLNTLAYHSYTERNAKAAVSYVASEQASSGRRPEIFSAAYNAGLIQDKSTAAAAAEAQAASADAGDADGEAVAAAAIGDDDDDEGIAADADEEGSAAITTTTDEIDDEEARSSSSAKVALGD